MTGRIDKVSKEITATTQHVLIAGEAGSGKSTVINNLINAVLYSDPVMNKLVLIDPKKVELSYYMDTQHCMAYADSIKTIERLLSNCVDMMERRFEAMKATHTRFYKGSKVYIIIDELADLAFTSKAAMDYIQRLAQMGRAANIQIICATQCPLASVIPTRIKVNLGYRIGLHTASRQDSRNILDVAGCEALPRFGQGIIKSPEGIRQVTIVKIPDEEIEAITNFRTKRA